MANNPGIPQSRLIAATNDTAAAPSVQFGGTFDINSGKGMYADASAVHIAVGGVARLSVSATAVTLGAGVSLSNIQAFASSASLGGAATETLVVTGLLATDTILAVSQRTPGANSLPLLGYANQANNALQVIYSADPGAGAVIIVSVKR